MLTVVLNWPLKILDISCPSRQALPPERSLRSAHRGVRRSQLHCASAGAAKAPYSLSPSSFPNCDRCAGSQFGTGGQSRPPLQKVAYPQDGGQAAFYGYATIKCFDMLRREIFRQSKALGRWRTVCTSSPRQRRSGGKDPPALIYASESKLLFRPYTAASTSES